MKVVYILTVFPKISETFILNEIIEVQNNGLDVEVFAFSRSNENVAHPQVKEVKKVNYLSSEKKSPGILLDHLFWLFKNPLRYFKALVIAANKKNGITGLFLFHLHNMKAIAKGNPDVVHAHFGVRPSDMAMLVNLLTGIRYTFTTHRFDIFDHPPVNYCLKSRLAAKHITISQYNKNYLIKHFGVAKEFIAIIHCGVDFEKLPAEPASKVVNQIICIARLEKEKGLDTLIEACALLNKRRDFRCLIIGDGSLRGELNGLIANLYLAEKVHLLGYKARNEVFALLKQSAVMVLTSRSEGIPVSLMEAMALRIPVIATRITGIPELIEDGINGFLFDVDDVSRLVDKIDKILNGDQNCEKLCTQAYEKVFQDFNLVTEVKKLISLWKV
jgi:glycosyltransferase involved in cell wall biosynthesis